MKKVFMIILFLSVLFANVCDKKLFSLSLNAPMPLKSVLMDLSHECNLNIIFSDKKSKEIVNKHNLEFVNISHANFKEFLDTLFEGTPLFYTLKDNKLILSFYRTKTFTIDFIPNIFSGSSSLDATDNSVNSKYSFDFWKNLKNNLIQILKNIDKDYKPPVIDKNSGLITVTGNKKQLKEIAEYLEKLSNRITKEVLVDVKIYSVELSASHTTGIDWAQLSVSLGYSNNRNEFFASPERVPVRSTYLLGKSSIFNAATFNMSAFLNFLAKNGNVNSISNPKIVTLNNQKAIISIGDTVYYKYASKIDNESDNPTVEYEIESKFVGVLLDITPQISDDDEIILNINPRISAFKDVNQINNPQRDRPPDTKDNMLITTVKLRNNQTLVLGGLITDDKNLQVNGVPILKEIPLIKYLFSSKETFSNKKELVFVITPRIIDLNKNTSLKDYGYKKLPSLEDLDVK